MLSSRKRIFKQVPRATWGVRGSTFSSNAVIASRSLRCTPPTERDHHYGALPETGRKGNLGATSLVTKTSCLVLLPQTSFSMLVAWYHLLLHSQPELTMKVNVRAAENLVRAIHAQPEPDRVSLVYIGTVAQTGNRPAPIHWGRIGDPIKFSTFDTYALSKTIAERIVVDSGFELGIVAPDRHRTFSSN